MSTSLIPVKMEDNQQALATKGNSDANTSLTNIKPTKKRSAVNISAGSSSEVAKRPAGSSRAKKSTPSIGPKEVDHFPHLPGSVLQDFLVPDACTAEGVHGDLATEQFPSSSSAKNKDSFMDMAMMASGGEFDGPDAEEMFLRSRSSSFGDDSTQTTSDGVESIARREKAEHEISTAVNAGLVSKTKRPTKRSSSGANTLSEEDMLLDLTPGTASQVQAAKLSAKLTAKEKNREHAKNTRMRKKKFIEALKDSIKVLTDEKEKGEREKRISLNRTMEQNTVRKRVLQDFLNFRTKCILDRSLWTTLLEENAMMILPITPYRSFPPIEVYEGQRYVKGIEAIMLDTASLNLFLQTIVPVVGDDETSRIETVFACNFQDALINEDSLMLSWDLSTTNAIIFGSRCELSVHGMLKVTFSTYNKIIYAELSFDVMSVMQQIRRAGNRSDFQVIPNTPPLAVEVCREARLICEGMHPYKILFTNNEFQQQFPFPDLVGNPLVSTIQSRIVERGKVSEMNEFLMHFLPYSTIVTMYTNENMMLRVWLKLFPLYSKAMPSQFLCVMEALPPSTHMASMPGPSYYSSSTSSHNSTSTFVASSSMAPPSNSVSVKTLLGSSLNSSTTSSTSTLSTLNQPNGQVIHNASLSMGPLSMLTSSSGPSRQEVVETKSRKELTFPSLNGTLDVAYQRPYMPTSSNAGEANRTPAAPPLRDASHSTNISGNSIASSLSGNTSNASGTSSISHAYRRAMLQKQQKLQQEQQEQLAQQEKQQRQALTTSHQSSNVTNTNVPEDVESYFSEFLQDFSTKSASSNGENGSSRESRMNMLSNDQRIPAVQTSRSSGLPLTSIDNISSNDVSVLNHVETSDVMPSADATGEGNSLSRSSRRSSRR